MAQINDIIRTLDELLSPGDFQRPRPERAAGPGRAGGHARRHRRVSARRELQRARGRARGAARARPPRPVLELPPDRADAAAGRAAAAAVQARHQPRRLPPAARRASRGRQQRDPRARARVRRTSQPFGVYKGTAIGVRGRFDGEGLDTGELHERVHAATGREPLLLGAGPERIRTIGIVSGSAADTSRRGRRGRPGRLPDRRAARAHHGRGGGTPRPLRRCGALRHGDLRCAGPRRAPGGPIWRSNTPSSICRTRSRPIV